MLKIGQTAEALVKKIKNFKDFMAELDEMGKKPCHVTWDDPKAKKFVLGDRLRDEVIRELKYNVKETIEQAKRELEKALEKDLNIE